MLIDTNKLQWLLGFTILLQHLSKSEIQSPRCLN